MGRPKKEKVEEQPKEQVENTNRFSKLDELAESIRDKYGSGIAVDQNRATKIARYKISNPTISYILGGGLPKGRIIEIFGPSSSGKTTLTTQFCADIQAQGGVAGWVDAEHAFDPEYAQNFGLDPSPSKFRLYTPEYGEQALDIVEMMIDTGSFSIIAIDSVAALVPKAEVEGEMADQQMGLQARMIGKGLRKIVGKAQKSGTTLVFLNQIRMKIGFVMGNPETTPGGMALPYFSSIRLDVRKRENITGNNADDIIGVQSHIKAVKNKTAVPFRKGEIQVYFATGIDNTRDYLRFAVSYNVVDKRGGHHYFKKDGLEIKLGASEDKAVEELKLNKEFFDFIKSKVDFFLEGGKIADDVIEEDEPDESQNLSEEDFDDTINESA